MFEKYFLMKNRWKSSLAAKQLTYILLFSSIITLFVTLIQLYIEYRADISIVKTQIEQIEKVHLESLTNSLWALDKNQIQIQLNSILSIQAVEYIEIRYKGLSLFSVGQFDKSKHTIARDFKMIINHAGKNKNIGTLRVIVSLEGVYSRIVERALVILVTQGMKTFVVSMFILFIIHRLVTRHVIALVNYTKKMDLNKPYDTILKKEGSSGYRVLRINSKYRCL
ncbi:MAG: hypothetical protein GY710_03140 [Desulfobacteraceae bacterium]|nr:hypothetical protein [Desulfobacteraceae bacterium]